MIFYHVYVACLLGVNFVILIPQTSAGQSEGNEVFSVSWIALHGLSLLALVSLLGKQNSRNLMFAVATGAFIVTSAAWSVAPTTTLTYGALLAGNILVAHLMASEFSLGEIVLILARTVFVLCLLAIVAYYIGYSPVYYFDGHERMNILGGDPFRGFFPHKVMASLYATLGAAAILATTRGLVRLVCLCVLGFFVALTSSVTGIILFVLVIVLYPLGALLAQRRVTMFEFFVGIGAALAAVTVIAITNSQALLNRLGRNDTLTGRTYLWDSGLDVWLERPLLGWGFNAYLKSPDAVLLNSTFRSLGDYSVPHFHQSYIQTAVDLGIVGVAILIFILGYLLVASYHYATTAESRTGIFAFVATVIVVIAAMTMFLFFNYNHFATFLIFLLFFALRRANETLLEDELPPSSDLLPAQVPRVEVSWTPGARPRPKEGDAQQRPRYRDNRSWGKGRDGQSRGVR